jgi:hypothetical protein
VMLTGSTHPAILTNSRWRAVSCIDPGHDEKCRDRLSSNIARRDSLCWRHTSYNFRLAMLIAIGPSRGSRGQ